MNPLEKLAIDYWYKALAVAGIVVFITSLTVEMVAVDNNAVQLLSLGCFLFGLGEWSNHPLQTRVGVGYKITGHPWSPRFSGVVLDILGLLLIAVGLVKLF